jgi:hypothetical protein
MRVALLALLVACSSSTSAPPPTPPPASKPDPSCGMHPDDWCPSAPGDPCGEHKDKTSCAADERCGGLPYRGESLVACHFDARGFADNCPTVGCVTLRR